MSCSSYLSTQNTREALSCYSKNESSHKKESCTERPALLCNLGGIFIHMLLVIQDNILILYEMFVFYFLGGLRHNAVA